ncbi:MAG: hypothetical protein HDS68_01565 [Bacteroidales bacterium]|nr:hypothetical protein [Bacteroidales bacterium]
MNRADKRMQGLTAAISGLWRNWAVAVGLLTILAVCAPLVPRQWLAPINIVFFLALQWMHSAMRKRDVPSCSRLIQEVSAVILVTALFVVALHFFARGKELYEVTGQPFLADSPLIAILVTAPVASIVTLVFLLRRSEPLVCQKCKVRYGNVIEHGFVGKLFRREFLYQTRMLFALSVLLSVIEWGYYLVHYVNINLNKADFFFFVWLPLALYVLSLVYLGCRYYSLWVYYCHNDEDGMVAKPSASTLRYLILNEDKLFISIVDTGMKFGNGARMKHFDTPAVIRTSYSENENIHNAIRLFEQSTGIRDAVIRLAYTSPDTITYQNVFHYFAFLPDSEAIIDSKIEGEWLTWGHLRQMAHQKLLSSVLVSELNRIYKVAMAWKTYDEQGRRLYSIKHYRPTFRLRDIKNWEVDFDDPHWLIISKNNQDSFWYPIRRLFNKRMRRKKRAAEQ